MKLDTLKVIFAVVIFVTTLLGNITALFITTPKWTSRLEALAGGVFLGAGLAHLLADATEEIEKVKGMKYPLAPAVAISTFVLLTIVELFSYSESDARAAQERDESQYDQIINSQTLISINGDADASMVETRSKFKTVEFGTTVKNMTAATISLYVIMDIHSTIEGIALGILPRLSSTIAIFCAIVGHKPVEAFALSLIVLKDKPTRGLFWFMVILYAFLSPIGVVAAIFLGEISGHLALGIIASISAGTFLFVGCHEWSEMFEHKSEWKVSEKLWHLGMFILGVLWMLLIAIIEGLTDED